MQDIKFQRQGDNDAPLTRSQNTAAVQVKAVMASLPSNSKNAPMLFSTNICIMLPLMKLYAWQ